MVPPFEVLPYSAAALNQCLVTGSKYGSGESIESKRHCGFLNEYLGELRVSTIVVEKAYIDRDYLEDYAAYYDRCFQDYPRQTQRLHFFSESFDVTEFENVLLSLDGSLNDASLQQSYLGFIVIKPLPQTVIGKTCLRTYPSDGGRRHFPSLRNYPVNLFGIQLSVQSLAYQEQDTVVAACATSALWSCFQGTGKLFQHMIPPPVLITSWAGSHLPENLLLASSRAFPNSGLTPTQMAHAVRKVGLEPLVLGVNSRHSLNGAVYAYLRGKIPSILAASLHKEDLDKMKTHEMGGHAIALTGFSLGEENAIPYGETGFLLRASRIDKLYGHDDQVGPFARMRWHIVRMPVFSGDPHITPAQEASETEASDNSEEDYYEVEHLLTSWHGYVHAKPLLLLLPLYHKIRIPYQLVLEEMLVLDFLVENVRSGVLSNVPRAEWDIYLTTAGDFKSSVRQEYPSAGISVSDSLFVNLPRFIWRVTVRTSEVFQLDLLFDATGISQHGLLVHVVSADREYAQILGALATKIDEIPFEHVQLRAVLERFSQPAI